MFPNRYIPQTWHPNSWIGKAVHLFPVHYRQRDWSYKPTSLKPLHWNCGTNRKNFRRIQSKSVDVSARRDRPYRRSRLADTRFVLKGGNYIYQSNHNRVWL